MQIINILMELPRRAPLKKNLSGYPIEGSALLQNENPNATPELVQKNILIKSIDSYFHNEITSAKDIADAQGTAYWGSQYQRMQYEELKKNDPLYENFIIQTYGSYSNFEESNKVGEGLDVFNPYIDYKIDVTIITEDKYYKTDHISPYEMISEALSGICTVEYITVKGKANRLIGTLFKKLILPSKSIERSNFFFPLPGNRVGMWDLVKQDWSTFYMNRVIRFVRDDTTGLE